MRGCVFVCFCYSVSCVLYWCINTAYCCVVIIKLTAIKHNVVVCYDTTTSKMSRTEYFFMCNVKDVAHSDESTERYHPILQLNRALKCLSAHCFSFTACNFTVLVHSHQCHFQPQQAAGFLQINSKNPLYTTCPASNSSQTQLATSCWT